MSDSKTVQAPNTPLAIIQNATLSEGPQTLVLKQHDDSTTGRDFTITRATDGTKLYTVHGHNATNAFQRTFRDALDQPILELRRKMNSMSGAWYAETPDPGRETVMTADMKTSWTTAKVDATFRNVAAAAVGEVKLEVRGKDISYKETEVFCGGKVVVRVRKVTGSTMPIVPYLNSNKKGKRDTWEVDVAEGVDLALVSRTVLSVCDEGDVLTG